MPLRRRLLAIALGLALPLGLAHAAEADINTLVKKASAAYTAKDYLASAEAWVSVLAAGGDEPAIYYNAACAYALAGRHEAAFDYLQKATAAGYTKTSAIRADADLASLHADPRFDKLMADTEAQLQRSARMWNSTAFVTPYQPLLDENERIAGLSRLWSEAKFNFANFDLVPELDWDALYTQALPRVRSASSTADYYQALRAFIAQLHDGHSGILLPAAVADQLEAQPGIRTALVEDRVFVRELLDPALAATGIAPGMEIVTVEGQPVKAWAQAQIVPYQPASTPQDRAARSYERALLSGPLDQPVRVGLRDGKGRTRELSLPRLSAKAFETAYWAGPTFEMKMLPGNVAYVRVLHFGDRSAVDAFVSRFEEISKAAALIIDVRENGGGDSSEAYRLLSMLSDRPFRTSRWRTRDYLPVNRAWSRPEQVHAGEPGEVMPDGERHYAGPVLMLTSARTYSAAEDFVVAFDAMKRGHIVGEATGGSTGQPLWFDLPGGGRARICTKRDSYPDGREFVGVGVQPQVVVHPTVSDLRAGRDTVLEAALALLASTPEASQVGTD